MKVMISTLLAILSFPVLLLAHQHVVNKNPEEVVVKMNSLISLWNKSCLENENICWPNDRRLNSEIRNVLVNYPISKIQFAENSSGDCRSGLLTMKRSSLFKKDVTRKSDEELSIELINARLRCQGKAGPSVASSPKILPLGESLEERSLISLNYGAEDILVSTSSENAHEILRKEISCRHYQYLTSHENIFWVRCLDNELNYTVEVLNKSPLKLSAILEP